MAPNYYRCGLIVDLQKLALLVMKQLFAIAVDVVAVEIAFVYRRLLCDYHHRISEFQVRGSVDCNVMG